MGKKLAKNVQIKVIVGGVLLALVFGWLGIGGTLLYQHFKSDTPVTERNVVQNDGNALRSQDETTVSSVYENTSKSVVSIITEVEQQSLFWSESMRSEGAGTGIIVTNNGVILTNKHVIKDASNIRVVMSDGTIHRSVSLLGVDPLNDIAFLKIKDMTNLPAVELGDSSTVKIGQRVIAIGNSLGQYQNTVTSGIISGKGRPIEASDGASRSILTDLLQTDAAINPGNSGGPLLNTSGQVVGINTAIAKGAEGIGFAIPINAAKGILKQIDAGKESFKRAFLGVRYLPINNEVAEKFKLTQKQGAFVYADGKEAIEKDGPADKAGIQKDDIITKINDVEVGERGSVLSLVSEYAPGDVIEITLVRDGKTKVIKATLGSY